MQRLLCNHGARVVPGAVLLPLQPPVLTASWRRVCIHSPQGQLLGSYSAYDEALGVRSTSWSPSSQFLAVGSCDMVIGPCCPPLTPPATPPLLLCKSDHSNPLALHCSGSPMGLSVSCCHHKHQVGGAGLLPTAGWLRA